MAAISLFSQSLFALPLSQAIAATAEAGFEALELACREPHFDLELARRVPEEVAGEISKQGLTVSALSLFSSFTDPDQLERQIGEAEEYLRLTPMLQTRVAKLTPGGPASAEATDRHWDSLSRALDRLIPLAEDLGIRLACETHMCQVTDTLVGTRRLLDLADSPTLGLTVDFSNMTFAGESMSEVVDSLSDRMYNVHAKNGIIDESGNWRFLPLDRGWTDYAEVLELLRNCGYENYVTIECLGEDARSRPVETARRDGSILRTWMAENGWEVTERGSSQMTSPAGGQPALEKEGEG